MLLNPYFTPPGSLATTSVAVVPDTRGSYIYVPPRRQQDTYSSYIGDGPHPSPHGVYSTHTGPPVVTETQAPRLSVPSSHTRTIPIRRHDTLPPPSPPPSSLHMVSPPHDPSCSPSPPTTPDGLPPEDNVATAHHGEHANVAMLQDIVMKRRTHDYHK